MQKILTLHNMGIHYLPLKTYTYVKRSKQYYHNQSKIVISLNVSKCILFPVITFTL